MRMVPICFGNVWVLFWIVQVASLESRGDELSICFWCTSHKDVMGKGNSLAFFRCRSHNYTLRYSN